jgi:hypothetical protein
VSERDELAGVENQLRQATMFVQSLAMAATIPPDIAKRLLDALGNGQPPAVVSDRAVALDDLTNAGDCAIAPHDRGAVLALIGIGRALLAIDATLRPVAELVARVIADEYDDYHGIETVDTKGRT